MLAESISQLRKDKPQYYNLELVKPHFANANTDDSKKFKYIPQLCIFWN